MVVFRKLCTFAIVAALGTTFASGNVHANTCAANIDPGTSAGRKPISVVHNELEQFINELPSSKGIRFSVEQKKNDLWIDILDFPARATFSDALRLLYIVGQVSTEEFETLVLADNDQGLFQISASNIKDIGCQFAWNFEDKKGHKPIERMRQFVDALFYFGSGRRVAPEFESDPLRDTTKALKTLKGTINPKWMR